MFKLEATYNDEVYLEETITEMPANQGGGIITCKTTSKPEVILYINVGNYDMVTVTPV